MTKINKVQIQGDGNSTHFLRGDIDPDWKPITNHVATHEKGGSDEIVLDGLTFVHEHAAESITSGLLDGNRLQAPTTTKKGAVPAIVSVVGKFLKDTNFGTWTNIIASDIVSGTLDGDRLPAISIAKRGGVPATGTPTGRYLKDDGTWTQISNSVLSHKTSHENGGSDEISLAGLAGLSVTPQTPTSHTQSAESIDAGTLDGARLPSPTTTKKGGVPSITNTNIKYLRDDGTWQTPPDNILGIHKTTHQNGGTDEISVAGLSGLLADGQAPLAHNQAAETINSGLLDGARLQAPTATKKGGVPAIISAGKFLDDSGAWADIEPGDIHATTPATYINGDLLPALSATKKGGVPATGTPSGKVLSDANTWVALSSGLVAHASSHGNGGTDEISVAGLSGLLADPQTPLAHNQDAATITSGALDGSRLPARTATKRGGVPPVASPIGAFLKDDDTWATSPAIGSHKATHQDGGTDEISLAGLSGLTADQIPAHTQAAESINSGTLSNCNLPTPTTTKKGGVPALSNVATQYLNGQGAWATPPSGGSAVLPFKTVGFTSGMDYVCGGTAANVQIQQAIDYCYANGGGEVRLAAGIYNLAAKITLKSGVGLFGVLPAKNADYTAYPLYDTRFYITDTVNNAIEVQSCSYLSGIQFYYPNQHTNSAPIAYPATIATSVGVTQFVMEHCYAVNPYDFISFLGNGQQNCINDVVGYPLHCGIAINREWDVTRLTNIHFWPYPNIGASPGPANPGPVLIAWVWANGVAYDLTNADGLMMANCFAYGYHRGLRGTNEMGLGVTMCWFEACEVGIELISCTYCKILGGACGSSQYPSGNGGTNSMVINGGYENMITNMGMGQLNTNGILIMGNAYMTTLTGNTISFSFKNIGLARGIWVAGGCERIILNGNNIDGCSSASSYGVLLQGTYCSMVGNIIAHCTNGLHLDSDNYNAIGLNTVHSSGGLLGTAGANDVIAHNIGI